MGIFIPPQLNQIQPTVLPSKEGLIRATMEHQDRQAALQQESKNQAQSALISALGLQQQSKNLDLQAQQQNAALQQTQIENQFRQQNQAMAVLENNRAMEEHIQKIQKNAIEFQYQKELDEATKTGDMSKINQVMMKFDPEKAMQMQLMQKKIETEGYKQTQAALGGKKNLLQIQKLTDDQITRSVDFINSSDDKPKAYAQERARLALYVPGLPDTYDDETMSMLDLYSTAAKNRAENAGKPLSGESAAKSAAAETLIDVGNNLLSGMNKLTPQQRLSFANPITALKDKDVQVLEAQYGLATELITVMITGAAATDPQYIEFKKQLPTFNALLDQSPEARERIMLPILLQARRIFEDIQVGRKKLSPQAEKQLQLVMDKYNNGYTTPYSTASTENTSTPGTGVNIGQNKYLTRGVKKLNE